MARRSNIGNVLVRKGKGRKPGNICSEERELSQGAGRERLLEEPLAARTKKRLRRPPHEVNPAE